MDTEIVEIDVYGLESFETALSRLDVDIRTDILKFALAEGAVVLAEAMERHAPERPPGSKGGYAKPGQLKADIRIEIDPDDEYGSRAAVGPGGSDEPDGVGFVGRLVETGHRQMNHGQSYQVLLSHGRVRLKHRKNGGTVLGEVPPHPWAVPAFEESANQALSAFENALLEGIEKNTLALPAADGDTA